MCFLHRSWSEGKAIGVDMTQEMIERARANAQRGGYTNVEFYLGTIDQGNRRFIAVD
jgi:tRNA/tmRNA/rRNA uracil-C5-methylase (TrmA/RlmC/RlmD family)